MTSIYIQYDTSRLDDLHHADEAVAACANQIKQVAGDLNISKIFVKICPLEKNEFTSGQATETANTLLEAFASVLSRSMELFPDIPVDTCIPSASVGFSKDSKVHSVDFSHGRVQWAFMNSIVPPETPVPDFPRNTYHKVCMGGTFDRLHQGHKLLLLRAALSATDEAVVGVSSGDLVANKKFKEMLESFEVRQKNVTDFCMLQRKDLKWRIFPLMDPGGPAVSEPELEAIVVSPEAAVVEGVKKINQTRVAAGLNPLDVLGIPMIEAPPSLRALSADNKISSTTLRMRDKQRLEAAAKNPQN